MGNKNPGPGKRFGTGNRANPKGAGAHNPEVRKLRRMTQEQIAEIGSMILEGNLTELQAIVQDKSATVLKVWFSSVAVKAINKGDAGALNVILDRIVGKPKETLDVNQTTNTSFDGESVSKMAKILAKVQDEC